MALDNFENLKQELINLSGTNDIDSILDDAISVTEKRMFANSVEQLLIRPAETRSQATVSTTERFLALPPYFLEMRKLSWILDGDNPELTYRPPTLLQERSTAGRPAYYTVTSQIEFERIPEVAEIIEVQFFAQIVPLDGTNNTNSVLTNHPDIYVNGCRWYIEQYFTELENAAYFEQEFYKSIRGANDSYNKGRHGPTPARRTSRCIP